MKKILLIPLLIISTNVFAQSVTYINNPPIYNTKRDTTTGVIIINGKTLKYPKCIPENATEEQVNNLKRQLNYVIHNSGNIKINENPNDLTNCSS